MALNTAKRLYRQSKLLPAVIKGMFALSLLLPTTGTVLYRDDTVE
jgi:hypothetical protein